MTTTDDAKAKARRAYDAAADTYDDPANSFWERFGRRTIERLALRGGDHVLDVCCGSGASAIPAAERVGPHGAVLAIDLAPKLLQLGRQKAQRQGLANVEFQVGDMLDLGALPEFDAVVCVFGVFFVPDMASAVRSLWARVRPGGALAITTWGPRFFEPAASIFWNSIHSVRPDLHRAFNPWDRISEPSALLELLTDSGIEHAQVLAESASHLIPSPEAWWTAVIGSGFRGTIDQLSAEDRERVRAENFEGIRRHGISAIEANVVYAIARKPVAASE
jgi:ubiquinone/menaquinone biosynthesis C-methylase UbiE